MITLSVVEYDMTENTRVHTRVTHHIRNAVWVMKRDTKEVYFHISSVSS